MYNLNFFLVAVGLSHCTSQQNTAVRFTFTFSAYIVDTNVPWEFQNRGVS